MAKLGKNFSVVVVLGLLLCLVVALAPSVSAQDSDSGQAYHPIMHPDRETLEKWIAAYNAAPTVSSGMKMFQAGSIPASKNLLSLLQYTPTERAQGWCGNCWAWAGTGCLEIALNDQKAIKDRLSVQYINSCESGVIGKPCCEGGWLSDLADFYDPCSNGTGQCIPWSNTNAYWHDSKARCHTTCSSISTMPNYPICSCDIMTVETFGVGQATAINNIKSVLSQNKAIWFGYFMPTGDNWADFMDFWRDEPESTIWSPDYSCGHEWNPWNGGGHAVLCVGYNAEDPDPAEHYWIMLNSWGTTNGRPNGLFRMAMDMNYDCEFNSGSTPMQSFYWQTLDVDFCEESTFDFGDAPSPYPTLLSDDGARHYVWGFLWMGAQVDTEVDGQPPNRDDVVRVDDEDGVTFLGSSMVPGGPYTMPYVAGQYGAVEVEVSVSSGWSWGWLLGWIDWNQDGDWDDDGENVISDYRTSLPGTYAIEFDVPTDAAVGTTWARFRLSSSADLTSVTGLAVTGEVEDYQVTVVPPPPDIRVDPSEIYVTMPPDTVWQGTLEIHNDGGKTLGYSTETWLAYDDGTADNYIVPRAGQTLAVRFTPPKYPAHLDIARFCLNWGDPHGEFAVEIYDDDGPGGKPGTLLGSINTTATHWGWWDVDISGLGITINDGDFYIGYHPFTDWPNSESLGWDTSAPDRRSWEEYVSGSWALKQGEDYMIRCRVDFPDCPWLDKETKSSSVEPGSFDSINVTIDTHSLAPGSYSCSAVKVGASQGKLEFQYQEEVTISPDEIQAAGMTTGVKAAYTWQASSPSAPGLENILVYTDDVLSAPGNTYVEQALQEMGLSYDAYYADPGGFGAALTGGTEWDLVAVSHNNYYALGNWWSEIEDYIKSGGKVIIETFDIDGSHSEANHPMGYPRSKLGKRYERPRGCVSVAAKSSYFPPGRRGARFALF